MFICYHWEGKLTQLRKSLAVSITTPQAKRKEVKLLSFDPFTALTKGRLLRERLVGSSNLISFRSRPTDKYTNNII